MPWGLMNDKVYGSKAVYQEMSHLDKDMLKWHQTTKKASQLFHKRVY
jgi:hypothetical protein